MSASDIQEKMSESTATEESDGPVPCVQYQGRGDV